MLNVYEKLDVIEQSVIQLQKSYEVSKRKFENGMCTSDDVLKSLNSLRTIQLQQAEALLQYNLAKKQFNASWGIGIANIA